MVQLILNQPLIRGYLFYASVLVLKTFLMSTYTALKRMRKKVAISSEDVNFFNKMLRMKEAKVATDEDVERIRRAHLNDLENIPLFIICGFIYILTKPDEMIAMMMFRMYTIFRIFHTIIYTTNLIRQPARSICYGIPYTIGLYMSMQGIITFFNP